MIKLLIDRKSRYAQSSLANAIDMCDLLTERDVTMRLADHTTSLTPTLEHWDKLKPSPA